MNEKKIKYGGQKMSALGERLSWFKDYLPAVSEEETPGISLGMVAFVDSLQISDDIKV